ncbi:hypothetical protein E2C01_076974 [Portunus trituberculatus]|uniref:Secreted protein n=1 Tax=Portunus trituberculatus TaxID=210409 RepID=A0A5B7IKH8_PORTR|nr:hypothetical protein [Portunus trituberculatus]
MLRFIVVDFVVVVCCSNCRFKGNTFTLNSVFIPVITQDTHQQCRLQSGDGVRGVGSGVTHDLRCGVWTFREELLAGVAMLPVPHSLVVSSVVTFLITLVAASVQNGKF